MGTKLDIHGEGFLSVLVGRQLRLSAACASLLVAVVLAGPFIELMRPGATAELLLDLPVRWWLLAAGVFPALVALAWSYTRREKDLEDEMFGLADVATLDESPRLRPSGVRE